MSCAAELAPDNTKIEAAEHVPLILVRQLQQSPDQATTGLKKRDSCSANRKSAFCQLPLEIKGQGISRVANHNEQEGGSQLESLMRAENGLVR